MLKKKLLYLLAFVISSQLLISAEKNDYVKFGGALRFNNVVENYENGITTDNIYSKLDTWFLSVDAQIKGLDISMQYRFYPDFKTHFIHHGYFGYQINEQFYAKLGVFQKPFGLANFASHSWWFQIPYYLGFEDTYNTGVGLEYKNDKLSIDGAYFRQAAPRGPISDNNVDNGVGNGRYSYAVVSTTGVANGIETAAAIRELDQFNMRLRYRLTKSLETGLSAQMGSIYNSTNQSTNWGLSWAAHAAYNKSNWDFKAQVMQYHYNAQADNGAQLDIVQMAAYGSAYNVAAKGTIYLAGLAYTIPVNGKLINSIQPYFDYSVVDKQKEGYASTQHLIPGVLITAGPAYIYVDYAMGKNQPWLTSNFGKGLGEGDENARWNSRFNVNIGYYF